MRSLSILSVVSGLVIAPSVGHALTLAETISAAKGYNFEIKSQGQKVKISETNKTESLTKFLPSITTGAMIGKTHNYYRDYRSSKSFNNTNPVNTSININQSLFNGGGDTHGVKVAQFKLAASKEDFRSVVNDVLLRTIQAYEDVSTKRKVFQLNEDNVKVYNELIALNQTKFELGEITITDISQTKSRLADAVAGKDNAYAEVLAAEASFENLVGMKAPADLKPVVLDKDKLPKSLDEFLHATKKKNPAILSARSNSSAASRSVNVASAELMPNINSSIAIQRSHAPQKTVNGSNVTYSVSMEMPIFQRGAEYTAIKRSKEAREDAKYNLSRIETAVQAGAVTAWNNYSIINSVILSKLQAIDAAEKSLAGVREETKMGTRTTLDVLQEQANLFQAQVSYRKAVQQQVLSYYSIYSYLGELDGIKYS